jgi:conjugal transfer/entry exclusion protein
MSWWSDLAAFAQRVLTLSRELDQQRADIKEMQTQIRDLTAIVRALAQENRHAKEQADQRHENLLLEIDNRLLKYEKALPPARASKKAAKKVSKK